MKKRQPNCDLSKCDGRKYGIIYADPPWAYLWGTGKDGGNFAPEKKYPTMTTEEICALDIKKLRASNCVLALWATAPCLQDAFQVMKAWGFKYKTMLFVWVKLNPNAGTIVCGPGSYTRSACEYVLLGMRGHIKRVSTSVISQVLLEPRGRHSAKPHIVKQHLVNLFGDLPRIELFARNRTAGWDVFGNEVAESIEVPVMEMAPQPKMAHSIQILAHRNKAQMKQVSTQADLF